MGSLPKLSILKGASRKYTNEYLDELVKNVAVSEASSKLALIFDNGLDKKETLTYAELNNISNKWAHVIHSIVVNKNLQPNQDGDYIVAVNIQPSIDLVVVLLAILKTGAAYLPLDYSFPKTRIEHICSEAQPVIVISDLDMDFEDINTYKLTLNELKHQSQQKSELFVSHPLQSLTKDLAIALYTSGSTGVPKGVKLEHKTVLNRLNWQFKAFPYELSEDHCVFKTSLTFVDSVCEIWGPLIKARSLLIIPKTITVNPEHLVSLLDRYKVGRLVLVPSLLKSILMYLSIQNDQHILQNLKIWICSGETLTKNLVDEFFQYFSMNKQLCNFYGSTEIMGDVSYQIITGENEFSKWKNIPIGLPIDNTILYLLDSDYRPVKSGDIGELFVSGLNLAAGYINNRDPHKFQNNPFAIDPTFSKLFRTGDFARIINGVLCYEGRTDSQVKVRGNRVDLTEIEKALTKLDMVDKCIVLCYKPGEFNQTILAFVLTSLLTTEHQIEALLKQMLPAYMIPQVILIDSIPLLVNGKIDRQSLLKYYETNNNACLNNNVSIDYKGVPDHYMKAAKILFETIADVLDKSVRSAISINANFYGLGGNSLNSIYTITKLKEQGYKIGITDFISSLDLGEILERMLNEETINTQPPMFTAEFCQPTDKEDCIRIITESFFKKADLEQWVLSEMTEEDYKHYLDNLWEPLVEAGLSFKIKNEFGKTVGFCINFDAFDEPDIQIESPGLCKIFEYLEYLEHDMRQNGIANNPNDTLHCHMMGTHPCLSAKENVLAIQFMETEVYRIAKLKKFKGILTVNTSPLTQQLGIDVFNYEIILDHQVNQFVAKNNERPFGQAPDSQRAIVQYKNVF